MLFFGSRRPVERLATSFRWLESKPFPAERARFYSAAYAAGAYVLGLEKDNYFAWETMSGDRRFSDFVLEADVELDAGNGHSAVGVLFRHVNDENFYSFLVSTRGNFRIDVLFNNHPLHLVEWTRLPEAELVEGGGVNGLSRSLRVIAHGSRFSFQVDGEWVAELEDEVLPSGTIGFAAQNFAAAGKGTFRLGRILVDARPIVVEKEHLRWSYYAPISPAARLRLAETLFQSGNADAAAVQLRKGLKDRDGSVQEHFVLAECYTRLSLYDEALREVDIVLAREPAHREATLEKANLLYLANRLIESRDLILSGLAEGRIESGPGVWGLLGNAEYGLGNWDKAADAYRRAMELEPDVPLFPQNAARALERAGRSDEAAELYKSAARTLFAEEAFDELSMIVPRIRALAPDDPEARAMEAKMLYREGKTDEAFAILHELTEAGSTDSAVHYLLGLLLRGRGMQEDALEGFVRASELEPDFPLYQFRIAETLNAMGRDPQDALDRALLLSPLDPWANNLAGQLALEAGDAPRAVTHLMKAREAAPQEEDIRINLSEALSLAGRHDEALEALNPSVGSVDGARIVNQRGNVLARGGQSDRAVQEYEAAIRLDPQNTAYKLNCAAACIEVDMIHRAEEILSQVEPDHPSPSVYNLLGQVAFMKGERARAEAAYKAGLDLDPDNADLVVNSALLYRERGNHAAARDLLLGFLSRHPGHARVKPLLDRIRAEHEERLSCATCGREWWVPRDLPPQPAIRIRGEVPADAPAGRCPRCGKIYCVGCASAHLRDMRFVCPDCDELLKLNEDSLKWLLARSIGPS
jgi:tetratricopeptide (TPR) repeat protein